MTRQHIPTQRGACAPNRPLRLALLLAPVLLSIAPVAATAGTLPNRAAPAMAEGASLLLSDAETWKRLPRAEKGTGQRLPVWARALARTLPHTAAAMLELDYQHRALSPLPAKLRAKVRWVAAHALGCAYSEAYATADFLRSGGSLAELRALKGDHAKLPEAERLVLAFARKQALAPHATTDEEMACLVKHYGEKRAVALILLLAHASFQDRLLLSLNLSVEPGGPLQPVAVRFAPVPLGTSLAAPRRESPVRSASPVPSTIDREWSSLDLLTLHREIEKQRACRPRIRLPHKAPGAINWGLVCRTYQPKLAAAWAACRRNFGAEANQDPIFEASVFWVVTRARQSFY